MELMIDIETMGVGLDAVVIQIGMLAFENDERVVGWSVYPTLEDQVRKGRKADPGTVEWWVRDFERRQRFASILSDASETWVPELHDIIYQLNQPNWLPTAVWTNGNFDEPIMRSLIEQFLPEDVVIPWGYWNVMDLRTLKKVAGLPKKFAGETPHDALEDCMKQLEELRECRRLLNLK